MTSEQRVHYAAFLEKTKGFEAWAIARCLNRSTPYDWKPVARVRMAELYAEAMAPVFQTPYPALVRLDLESLELELHSYRWRQY